MLGKGKRHIYIKHKMSSCFKNMPFLKKVKPQHNLWTTTTTTTTSTTTTTALLSQHTPEDTVYLHYIHLFALQIYSSSTVSSREF